MRTKLSSLNNLFREWLGRYAGARRLSAEEIHEAAAAVRQFSAGRRFTRAERNER